MFEGRRKEISMDSLTRLLLKTVTAGNEGFTVIDLPLRFVLQPDVSHRKGERPVISDLTCWIVRTGCAVCCSDHPLWREGEMLSFLYWETFTVYIVPRDLLFLSRHTDQFIGTSTPWFYNCTEGRKGYSWKFNTSLSVRTISFKRPTDRRVPWAGGRRCSLNDFCYRVVNTL